MKRLKRLLPDALVAAPFPRLLAWQVYPTTARSHSSASSRRNCLSCSRSGRVPCCSVFEIFALFQTLISKIISMTRPTSRGEVRGIGAAGVADEETEAAVV